MIFDDIQTVNLCKFQLTCDDGEVLDYMYIEDRLHVWDTHSMCWNDVHENVLPAGEVVIESFGGEHED